jgi:hypothetical protein
LQLSVLLFVIQQGSAVAFCNRQEPVKQPDEQHKEERKNKVKKVGVFFSTPKPRCLNTTFTTQFTTITPSKHHVLHAVFRKNPRKTPQLTTPIFFSR